MNFEAVGSGGPHGRRLQRLVQSVLESDGHLSREVRSAIAGGRKVEGPLADYVEKVSREAHRITDADTSRLLAAGYSEDQIFEATVSAALGAGLLRLHAGLAALGKKA